MYFRQLLHDERSCASYVVGCPTLGLCAVIDPQGDPQTYADLAGNNAMLVRHVIDTHVHADHLSAARSLAAATGATLHLGPGAPVSFPHDPLRDGDVLPVGNRRIRVLHTPGHTPEHVCLLVDEWFLLTGDTLFVGDVGRVDLTEDGSGRDELPLRAKQLYTGLRRLLELPAHTEVFPGHYAGSVCGRGLDGKAVSTIGRERLFNPALGLDEEEFVRFQVTDLPPVPPDFLLIKQRNAAGD